MLLVCAEDNTKHNRALSCTHPTHAIRLPAVEVADDDEKGDGECDGEEDRWHLVVHQRHRDRLVVNEEGGLVDRQTELDDDQPCAFRSDSNVIVMAVPML